MYHQYQLDSRLDILVPLEWFLAKRIKTNRLLPVEKQLQMLRDIGFIEVDCSGNGMKWLC